MTVASRKQVPLKLAWALSIHKSQGMTLTRVCLTMNRIFEYVVCRPVICWLARGPRRTLLSQHVKAGETRWIFPVLPCASSFYVLMKCPVVACLLHACRHGQAYVALSRVRDLSGLRIEGWKRSVIKAHPKVIDYYAALDANEARAASTRAVPRSVASREQPFRGVRLPDHLDCDGVQFFQYEVRVVCGERFFFNSIGGSLASVSACGSSSGARLWARN